ncbi:MAG: arsenite methyltransferase [Deltaproteobacteria bacterium]|nr:arsenite methyltransferase [Deltaproteobacteria bacterium]
MEQGEIRKAVRDGYGKIAKNSGSCCLPGASCGCGGTSVETISQGVGYTPEEMQTVPEGANLGLGCGNPVALASLKEGETVVDLGSGAGFDAFLAARAVGKSGRVIGVDMTPEMIDKARGNARKGDYENVSFRLGEIENLPVADRTADVIISNCVINLSPDKERVFREAFRVLKPGGRLMVSDIVLLNRLSPALKESIEAYVGCVAGAVMKEDYLRAIREAGFEDIQIVGETTFPVSDLLDNPAVRERFAQADHLEAQVEEISSSIASIKVQAVKPVMNKGH